MKVSVVIPTYNNECTIAATVESALAQRFDTGSEVIVVNDGSTDDTPAVLKQFGDRIHLIEQENRGASAARNAGIAAAAGGRNVCFVPPSTTDGENTRKT